MLANQYVWIAHGAGFEQIDTPAQQVLQIGLYTKKRLQPPLRIGRELDQEIRVAGGRVEILRPGPGVRS